MMFTGWKPRRSIILASWDAGEEGHIGSTEWVEVSLVSVRSPGTEQDSCFFLISASMHAKTHWDNMDKLPKLDYKCLLAACVIVTQTGQRIFKKNEK